MPIFTPRKADGGADTGNRISLNAPWRVSPCCYSNYGAAHPKASSAEVTRICSDSNPAISRLYFTGPGFVQSGAE